MLRSSVIPMEGRILILVLFFIATGLLIAIIIHKMDVFGKSTITALDKLKKDEKHWKVEKLKRHWFGEKFFLFKIQVGWEIYPIVYCEDRYVIEIIVSKFPKGLRELNTEDFTIDGIIYEYGEKSKLFRKHKRRRIYADDFSKIHITDNEVIDLRKLEDIEFLMQLPQIITSIFQRYKEDAQKKLEITKKLEKAKMWDGIVK